MLPRSARSVRSCQSAIPHGRLADLRRTRCAQCLRYCASSSISSMKPANHNEEPVVAKKTKLCRASPGRGENRSKCSARILRTPFHSMPSSSIKNHRRTTPSARLVVVERSFLGNVVQILRVRLQRSKRLSTRELPTCEFQEEDLIHHYRCGIAGARGRLAKEVRNPAATGKSSCVQEYRSCRNSSCDN